MPRLILEQEQPLTTLQMTLKKEDGNIIVQVKDLAGRKWPLLQFNTNGTIVRLGGLASSLEMDLDGDKLLIT